MIHSLLNNIIDNAQDNGYSLSMANNGFGTEIIIVTRDGDWCTNMWYSDGESAINISMGIGKVASIPLADPDLTTKVLQTLNQIKNVWEILTEEFI